MRVPTKPPMRFLFILLILGLTLSARAELNLSPEPVSFELDGVTLNRLAFENGTNDKATYQPPADWKYSGGKNQLDLQPPNLTQASIKVVKLPADFAISFDTEGRTGLEERTIGGLPEGSGQIRIEAEEVSPLKIDGKETYLVELSYVCYGEKFACYSLFLDRKPEPINFRLSCREKDYANLREMFQRSLFTWENL
jgi:hypothetical protein